MLVLAGMYLPALSQRHERNYISQFGLGYLQTPASVIHLDRGDHAIRPVRLTGLVLDYQRNLLPKKENWSWGLQGAILFYRNWWDLKNGSSYSIPSKAVFALEKLDHVELYGYFKRSFFLSKGGKQYINTYFQVGPAFNFNGNLHAVESLVPLRTDSQMPFLACTISHERSQPVWLPYLRAGAGLEIAGHQKKGGFWVLSPFAELAFWQADKETFTSFPNDPALLSKGHFKWNRTLLGCKLGLGR